MTALGRSTASSSPVPPDTTPKTQHQCSVNVSENTEADSSSCSIRFNWQGQQGSTDGDVLKLELDAMAGNLAVFKNGARLGVPTVT